MDGNNKEKQISTKLLIKSSFWYTISNFLTRAIVFLTTPIFARILTNEEYGNFTVFASWQAILIIVCGLEIYGTINRARFDFTSEEEFSGYISSCLTLSTAITALFFMFYLLFPGVFYSVLLLEKKYILVMFAYLFTYPAVAMFQAKQRIEYKYKLNAVISFVLIIASSLLAVSLALLLVDDRLFGRVIGQYMLYAVAGFIFYVYFIKKGHNVSKNAYKYAVRIGLPLVFSYLGGQLLLTSDNIIVKHMCSAEQVSYISMTHTCAHIILLFVQTLNSAWAPWFYDMLKLGKNQAIRNTYKVYLMLIMIGTYGVILLGPEIIMILGGERYREALYLLPAYILCGIFTVITAQLASLEIYYNKPGYAAIFTGIAAVVNIVLNIIGVNYWGYQSVCYATVISQLLLVGIHYYFTQTMGVRDLLPLKTLIIVLLVSLLMIVTALLLYRDIVIRFVFIGVLIISACVIVVVKRKEIIELIHKLK